MRCSSDERIDLAAAATNFIRRHWLRDATLWRSAGLSDHELRFPSVHSESAHDLGRELIQEYQRLAAQVAQQRERAHGLRHLAEHAEAQADRDERVLADVAAVVGLSPQLRIEDIDPRLRGPRLEEIAVQVLRAAGLQDGTIHYREWFALLRCAGYYVGGKDPLATFLAQINRSSDVERIGQRTGKYRLRVAT
jgi:hypothetical protein